MLARYGRVGDMFTGHTDIKEVQTYVAAANKKKAAKSGIDKLYGSA